jgi:hypothetical protein
MAIFVSISKACKAQAQTHAQQDTLRAIAENIEAQQSIAILDKHQPWPIIKKASGKFRAYAIEQLYEGGEHRVVRFAKFFVKADYPDFHKRIDEDEDFRGKFIEEGSLNADELKKFVEGRLREGVKEAEPLKENERKYLDVTSATLFQSLPSVYETSDWVDLLKAPWMNEYRRSVASILSDLVIQASTEERKKATRYPANRSERGVLYRQFNNGLMLIAPVGFQHGPQEEELRARYREVFEADESLAEEELRKFSLRTYPDFVVAEESLWVALQKAGREANLSLSPEEMALLHTLLTPGEKLNPYPLFINGRPGSGKTTILHYLFAEFLHHHLTAEDPLPDPPLYLTYSPALMERAKETVSTILACDYRRIESPPDIDSQEAQGTIGRAFRSFRDMLLSLLSLEVRARFDLSKYVDYPEFRKLWMKSLAQDNALPSDLRKSPELAWHAIRTFIKGRCPADGIDDDFDPERYAELPKRQKSIDEEIFSKIYEKIWLGWYKPRCTRDGLWDDQDLAIAVLRQDGLARFPALVCDEAQDFTANELAVILRLSLYSARKTPTYLLGKIPFAFAGDPFQTLNPTGFDWGALSDSFRENLLRELDPDGRYKLEINFRELEFNYRSAEPIVKIANLVQLLRGILFEVGGLRPQQTWRNEVAPDPALFDIGEASTRDALRRMDDLVFIVPSQEESELEYARGDSALRDIVIAGDKVTRDVFNPMRAKGMEFGRVVIYKFGAYCLENVPGLARLLAHPQPQAKKNRERLAYEYFLNRLYVALSRARSRLMIVDTKEAIDGFWSFARNYSRQELIERYRSGGWEPKNLGIVIHGTPDAWTEDVADDSADIGRQYFDNGRTNRDPYLLERAASRFDRVGDESGALSARAWACHFREEYADAGRLFARIPDVPNTLDNYWLAGEYAEFLNFARNKGVAGDPRFHAARYMHSPRREDDARTFFKSLSDVLQGRSDSLVDDKRMQETLDHAFATLFARLDAAPEDERLQSAVRDHLRYIERISDRLDWKPPAKVGYAVLLALDGKTADSAKTWKETRRPDAEAPEVVVRALAATMSFPDNLPHLRRLGDFPGIVEVAKSADWAQVPVKTIVELAGDLWTNGGADDFGAFARALPATTALAVFEGIPATVRESDPQAATLAGELLLRLAQRGDLRGYLGWLVDGTPPGISSETARWVKSAASKCPGLHRQGIRVLAAKDFDSKSIDAPLRDRIEEYFDNLIKLKHKDLNQVSPFEVGAVLELSGKFKLMQTYYEMVLKASDRSTDPQIVQFARERLLFAKVGLANVTKKESIRRQIEKDYKESARDWSINLGTMPSSVNLHRHRDSIEQFYHELAQPTDFADEARSVLQEDNPPPGAEKERPEDGGLLLSPERPNLPPLATKPLASALGAVGRSDGTSPIATSGMVKVVSPQTNRGAEVSKERPMDTVVVSSGANQFEVTCDYTKPRIEVRNQVTREAAVVRSNKNGELVVASVDVEVEDSGNGCFRLDNWGVAVRLMKVGSGRTRIEVTIEDGGPSVVLHV